VQHEQIWAPWRLGYIKGDKAEADKASPKVERNFLPGADETCFICRAVAESSDRENLLVRRDSVTVTILNRYPYNNGHLLVAPQRHLGRLDELSDETHVECMRVVADWVSTLERTMNAEGFNVGLNLGRVAGAGLPGHLHWHIVPRWNGDTNFMPVLAGVDVIPQSLDALWEMLSEAGGGE